MIALLFALALSNMPPRPPDTCKGQPAGTGCKKHNWTDGTCAPAKCPQTTFSPDGATTVTVDCMTCTGGPADGGK